jgi:hypothetical protein
LTIQNKSNERTVASCVPHVLVAMLYRTKTMWAIGTTVRVECGEQKRRGMVAYVNLNEEDQLCLSEEALATLVTYDIIYGNNSEENQVPSTRISSLLPIENPSCDHDPHLAKICGNYLFELKDYEAAYEYYLKSHQQMQHQEITIGKRILVHVSHKSGSYESGLISELHQEQGGGAVTVDVIFDRSVDGSDEEEGVSRKRIVNIFEIKDNPEMGIELQRSVFLNLSKCATKRRLKGWAVHWALLATGLIRGTDSALSLSLSLSLSHSFLTSLMLHS